MPRAPTDTSMPDLSVALAAARRQIARLTAELDSAALSHRRWHVFEGARGVSRGDRHAPRSLIQRMIQAYQAANLDTYDGNSMWTLYFHGKHLDAHNFLMAGDVEAVSNAWSNPGGNFIFWGFEEINQSSTAAYRSSPAVDPSPRIYDNLLRLAEAAGVTRLEYPEAPQRTTFEPVEAILEGLDQVMGFRIDFPNPFPGEYGLQTSRGVASYRAIQALYQAHRTKLLLADRPDAKVLEIGAGLGRSAYYCVRAGIKDYTIIDIPFTNASQAFYLGLTLGEEQVALNGEDRVASVKILTPSEFVGGAERYDLIVNFDSMTEIDTDTQRSYMAEIIARADIFLSVNHEHNTRSVHGWIAELLPNARASRHPYWMRNGYVEEVLVVPPAAQDPAPATFIERLRRYVMGARRPD